MKIKIEFDNGKTGDENTGFKMEHVGDKNRCLKVLRAMTEAITALKDGDDE